MSLVKSKLEHYKDFTHQFILVPTRDIKTPIRSILNPPHNLRNPKKILL